MHVNVLTVFLLPSYRCRHCLNPQNTAANLVLQIEQTLAARIYDDRQCLNFVFAFIRLCCVTSADLFVDR